MQKKKLEQKELEKKERKQKEEEYKEELKMINDYKLKDDDL
jgi:hypothetical protein